MSVSSYRPRKRARQGAILDIADKLEKVYNVGSNLYGRYQKYSKGSGGGTIARMSGGRRWRKKCCKETKWFDGLKAQYEPAYDSMNYTLLNPVAVGDDANEREGRVIDMQSLHIKGKLSGVAAMTLDPTVVRMFVIYDKWPNQGVFDLADVISVLVASSDIYSMRNRDNAAAGRFKVLKDWVTTIGSLTNSSSNKVKYFNWFIDLKKKGCNMCRFDAVGVTDTDFLKGKLIFCALTDGLIAGTGPGIEFRWRLNYIDP